MTLRGSTHAELAARLLRDAATFFRTIGEQNPALKEQMDENASVFEQVADLVEKDPTGTPEERAGEEGENGVDIPALARHFPRLS